MRGRSYTPSPPPRGYGRRGRSPSPRGRYAPSGRARDLPTSLLVRNLRRDCRPEDLRRPFEQFGALKDIYLPRDFYTGEPRGFGFVQYADPHDAAEAKHHMDGRVLHGRELTVVFAEENRKKPTEMRAREQGRGRHHDRRRSPRRYSRSPPPHRARSRSCSQDYYSPPQKRRHYSRSVSPKNRRYSQDRAYSQSRSRSQTPNRGQGRSPSRSRSRSRSPKRFRSQSPDHDEYQREANGDRSPGQ